MGKRAASGWQKAQAIEDQFIGLAEHPYRISEMERDRHCAASIMKVRERADGKLETLNGTVLDPDTNWTWNLTFGDWD